MCLQELLHEVLVIEARVPIRDQRAETELAGEPVRDGRWDGTGAHCVRIGHGVQNQG